jgi:hypothetical protein
VGVLEMTTPAFMAKRKFIIEGQTLRVSDRAFMEMRVILQGNQGPDVLAELALQSIGVPQSEIEAAKGRGFTVVVDYELE